MDSIQKNVYTCKSLNKLKQYNYMKFYSYYFKTFIQKIYASCIIKETY